MPVRILSHIPKALFIRWGTGLKRVDQNLPAQGVVTEPNVWVLFVCILEVGDVEDRESHVDVAVHGVVSVFPIGRDGEGPIIHQAGDHVWCEGNDHGLHWGKWESDVRVAELWFPPSCISQWKLYIFHVEDSLGGWKDQWLLAELLKYMKRFVENGCTGHREERGLACVSCVCISAAQSCNIHLHLRARLHRTQESACHGLELEHFVMYHQGQYDEDNFASQTSFVE